MKKIIQITSDHGQLHALTEDGKIYRFNKNKKETKGDFMEENCRERYVSFWEEIIEDKTKWKKPSYLPF